VAEAVDRQPIPPNPVETEARIQGDAASLRHALNLVGATAGGTAAGVGGFHLLRWLTAKKPPVNPIDYTPTEVDLRIPTKRKRPAPPLLMAPKMAAEGDLAERLSRWYNQPSAEPGKVDFWPAFSRTVNFSQPWRNIALTGAAGIGGGILGYQGAKAFVDSRKKKERQSDLADAQREYEDALFSQYDKSKLKVASAKPSALDALYEHAQKRAFLSDYYMPYAAGTGGLAAIIAYLNHRQDTQKLLEGALKRRAAARAAEQPPEISLKTSPVPVADEEEDAKPPRQRSSWGF
jgi:hypothetical protein